MAAVDTNVLVRLVTRDDPAQYQKARRFVAANQPVFVTQLSLLELVWVLTNRYGFDKTKTRGILSALLDMEELQLQDPHVVEAALAIWKDAKADFADCFILATVDQAAAGPLATFDMSLAKVRGCKKI